jgi:hypothetical protein
MNERKREGRERGGEKVKINWRKILKPLNFLSSCNV